MKRNKMLKRLSMLAVLAAVMVFPGPVSGDTQSDYTACMDRAINHKYALIADGWSYADAHDHYLWHTRGCYDFFYGSKLD